MSDIYDYIVIGAGIAGLTYAYRNKSNNFIILEKNDYIGGRIKNIKWNDSFISLGGGVFLPSHSYVLDLCREFNIETKDYTSIYHLNDLKGDTPNNPLYYKDFEIIYKSLVKKYYKHEKKIKEQKLNFTQFLELYFDYSIYEIIINNSLYSTNFNADPGLFLENEFLYDCLRIKDDKMMFIKSNSETENGYDLIINNIIKNIGINNIKINTNVSLINFKDNLYEIISNNQSFLTKKLVLATDIKSNIKFNLPNQIICILNKLYKNIGYEPYIRIYSYHRDGHNLKNSCKTRGIIGKTIIMNKNILMICYNESYYATNLNNLLNNKSKENQIEILYKLFKNHNLEITKPDDIYIQYWEVGMHYSKPGFSIDEDLGLLKNNHNLEVIGELVAKSHGWVNSALSSIK
jgi:hypothetical protein